ncbi:MAG: hypothetical protein M5U26_04895 [Planctomycetota bacterium]|nr:hypothetical protein [Planctomycetota bacterium]
MRDVRVAAAQMDGILCRNEKNMDRIEALTRKARKAGAEAILFPEMVISGFGYEEELKAVYEKASEPVPDGPSTQRLIRIARLHRIAVLAGISEKGDGELRYNTCVIVGPEGYLGKYRKVHMNSERWLYHEAGAFPVFDLPWGRIGVSICYDNVFCESARILAVKGAEVLFAPHCWGSLAPARKKSGSPALQVKRFQEREVLKYMSARANDNNLFAVYANMFGGPHRYLGASLILGPKGEVLAAFTRYAEGFVTADLKAEALVEARARRTCSLKRRRPELYGELAI